MWDFHRLAGIEESYLRLPGGKSNRHLRPFTVLTANRNFSVMKCHNPLYNGKPQAGTGTVPGFISAIESFEHMFQFIFPDTDAVI